MEKKVESPESILILGNGYTGRQLINDLKSKYPEARLHKTSREPEKADHICFDLTKPETHENLPKVDLCFWTFPPTGIDFVKKLIPKLKCKKLIIIGTTSSFLVNYTNDIHDNSPIDPEHPRTDAEELLIQYGAKVVHAAGIYGPKRNPMDWLRSKKVGGSDKLVNFIHRDDLARILIFIFENFSSCPDRIIASDSEPKSWHEIADFAFKKFQIKGKDNYLSKRASKSLEPRWLKQQEYHFLWPDFFQAIEKIEIN